MKKFGFPPIQLITEKSDKTSGSKEKFFSSVVPQENSIKQLLNQPKEKIITTEKIIDDLDVVDSV